MATHSLRDLEALPGGTTWRRPWGSSTAARSLGCPGLPRREVEPVGEVVRVSEAEKDLVAGWASADG